MSKKNPAKKTSFGEDLIEGMKQVLAHQRGEIELKQVYPKTTVPKTIRKQTKSNG